VIQAKSGLLGSLGQQNQRHPLNQKGRVELDLGRKTDMERAAATVVTGAVGPDRSSGTVSIAAIVLSHAYRHLGADGHEHDERQAANQETHSRKPPAGLEEEFRRNLHFPRWSGVDHLAEQVAADITIDGQRPEEVGVIERIEGFQTDLQDL
jgi:hypothetical protein